MLFHPALRVDLVGDAPHKDRARVQAAVQDLLPMTER